MRVACVAALLILLPTAMAGSAEDPEITDPANDQKLGGVAPIVQPPTGVTMGLNSDLLAAWIEDAGDALLFTTRLQGTASPTSTSSSLYTFSFAVDGQPYAATVHVGASSPFGNGAVTPGGVAAAATSASSHVTATVPKSAIGSPGPGSIVSGFFVTAEGRFADQVGSFTTDRAPDSGTGREFVLPGPAGPAWQYVVVADEALDIGNDTAVPMDGAWQFNWTTSGPAALQVLVESTAGVAAINISAPGWGGDNATRYACACNGSVNATVPAMQEQAVCVDASAAPVPCAFTVQVRLTGFVGSWSVRSVPGPEAPDEGTVDADPTGPAGNGTDDPQDLQEGQDPKDTPAPWVGLALAAAVALRRRR